MRVECCVRDCSNVRLALPTDDPDVSGIQENSTHLIQTVNETEAIRMTDTTPLAYFLTICIGAQHTCSSVFQWLYLSLYPHPSDGVSFSWFWQSRTLLHSKCLTQPVVHFSLSFFFALTTWEFIHKHTHKCANTLTHAHKALPTLKSTAFSKVVLFAPPLLPLLFLKTKGRRGGLHSLSFVVTPHMCF